MLFMECFNYNNLKNEYGLSCIEDYVIYILSTYLSYWPQIFIKSYLSFGEILSLLSDGQEYSYFTGIERLQNTAQKQGLCKLVRCTSGRFDIETIYNKLFIMQVKENFIYEKYKRKMWRKDHYILFKHKEKDIFEFINDIPMDSGEFTFDKLKEIYNHNLIFVDVLPGIRLEKKLIAMKCLEHMSEHNPKKNKSPLHIKKEISYITLRDSIGIMKVVIKRMVVLLNLLGEEGLDMYYEDLCQLYSKVEYMKLRKKTIEEQINCAFEILEKDKCYYEILYKKLKAIKEK